PHSHKDGPIERAGEGDYNTHEQEAHRLFPMRMCAGDAVAFSRLTVHGSGPNHTDKPRVAYALQYHRDDVQYRDPDEGGRLKRLVEEPRFAVAPVEALKPAQK
ncbi:MAG: phytanoyl-CoA dioxygenase family protein, partial [Planctomycetota bacterium]